VQYFLVNIGRFHSPLEGSDIFFTFFSPGFPRLDVAREGKSGIGAAKWSDKLILQI
jgi:hypothetical protein